MLDQTELLDELAPIHRGNEAEAAHAVGDGDLIGCRDPAGRLQELHRAHSLLRKPMLQPSLDKSQGRPLSLQPGVEVLHKRSGERDVGVRELGESMNEVFRPSLGLREHAIGPCDGHIALLATTRNAHTNATDILEQRQPQHDREGPQLAQAQRFRSLVCRQESRGVVAVYPAVLMGDQVQSDVIDSRKARRKTASQPRQLPAVAARKVATGQRYLLLDEIEVVQ